MIERISLIKEQTRRRIQTLGIFYYLCFKVATAFRLSKTVARYNHLKLIFRPIKSDLEVISSVIAGEFDATLEYLHILNTTNSLIVDAGGHIGMSAIWFANNYPKATIVTIEPAYDNYMLLRANINGYSNIIAINAALASEASSSKLTELIDRNTGPWGYSTVKQPTAGAKANAVVPTISLRQIADFFKTKITLLKLDIEGGEADVFQHDVAMLNQIDIVVAELHERIVSGVGDRFERCFSERMIQKLGKEKLMAVRY